MQQTMGTVTTKLTTSVPTLEAATRILTDTTIPDQIFQTLEFLQAREL